MRVAFYRSFVLAERALTDEGYAVTVRAHKAFVAPTFQGA